MTTKTPTMEMLKYSHQASIESVWLTALEAAQYLRVEPRTLLIWARQGKVKGYVLSGTKRVTWRFRAEDLDATMSPPSVALRNGRIQ
jgi:excisionase family DNA binding protein